MEVLYLTSSTAGAGKTGLAAGIGRRLVDQQQKVGYLHPVVGQGESGQGGDLVILARFLGLEEGRDALSPAYPDGASMRDALQATLGRISAGKDVFIIEGPSGDSQSAAYAATRLSAKIVGIEAFGGSPGDAALYYEGVGRSLAGIVLNKVPPSRLSRARSEFTATLRDARLLGVVPEERSLAAMSVAELARDVKGTIVAGEDNSSSLVSSIMLAAMNPDPGPEYYSLKENKAVIVRSERPDMQLAALETATSCLVLAGGQPPIQMVLRRAEARNVPIIATKEDVKSVVADIEAALRVARLDARRISLLAELVGRSVDFSGIL